MIIFKKMFAEKILRFHEAMNRFSELLMRMPHLGDKIRNQIENDNYRLKDDIWRDCPDWHCFI